MNKTILMGRLTKDPELRYTAQNNTAICSFTLAVPKRISKAGEEKQAEFIPIVAWGKQAEFCSKWFKKGRQIAVVGRLQVRSWEHEGKKHYITEVVAEETYFADSKKDSDANTNTGNGSLNGTNGSGEGFYPMDEDDELPF